MWLEARLSESSASRRKVLVRDESRTSDAARRERQLASSRGRSSAGAGWRAGVQLLALRNARAATMPQLRASAGQGPVRPVRRSAAWFRRNAYFFFF